MNVGESNAVFTLLGYLCPTGKHDRQIKEEEAARAAVTLAAAANKATQRRALARGDRPRMG